MTRLDLKWTGTQFLDGATWTASASDAFRSLDQTRRPEPTSERLRGLLAAKYDVPAGWIAVGPGSASVIDAALRWMRDRRIIDVVPNFKGARMAARRDARRYQPVVVLEPEELVDRVLEQEHLHAGDAVTILSSPRNPFGYAFELATIQALLRSTSGVVIVDEAYGEFAERSAISLVARHRNLIVTRTFSKAWGLCSARVGYAVGQMVDGDLRDAYLAGTVTGLSQQLAATALEHADRVAHSIVQMRAARDRLASLLRPVGRVWRSDANFMFVETPVAASWAERFARHGIDVMHVAQLSGHPTGCPDGLRVTVPPMQLLERVGACIASSG